MSKCNVKVLCKNEYMARLIVLIANELDFKAWISTRADGNINVIDSSFKLTEEPDYSKSIYLYESGEALPKGAGKCIVKPFLWEEMRDALLDMHSTLYLKEYNQIICDGKDLIYSGTSITLTSKEEKLFRYLYDRANTPVKREELLEKVWGLDEGENSANITDVYINYLRTKMRKAFGINPIVSVRGVGYMYTDKYVSQE